MSRNRKVSKNIYIPNQELYGKQSYFDIVSDNAFRNKMIFDKKQQQLKNIKR